MTQAFLDRAAVMDQQDPCAVYRDQFHIPEGLIYLDGNSLGLMPKGCAERLAHVANQEWSQGLIQSWTSAQWFDLPLTVGDRLAPLLGVGLGEIAVGDSTSVNLFKCLAAALHLRPERRVILAEADNFPTDTYMAQGLAQLRGDVEVRYFDQATDPASLAQEAAVVVLSHIDYRYGRMRDMASVSKAIQAQGAVVLWDLSHTTGAVHCDLLGSGADMAVGCTYKYLNGGPGAPAFTWVAAKHMSNLQQPLAGWMGHASPFDFSRDYSPAMGARRLVCGTPQVLSLSALDEALKLWESVDLQALWQKRKLLTQLFIDAVLTGCAGFGLKLLSPIDAEIRGSHVSFSLEGHGYEVIQALAARGVMGDFRTPSTIRFGFAPLYLSFVEVVQAAEHLKAVLENREWDHPQFRVRKTVT